MLKFLLIAMVTTLFGCHHHYHYKHIHKKPVIKNQRPVEQVQPAPKVEEKQEININIAPQEMFNPDSDRPKKKEGGSKEGWWFSAKKDEERGDFRVCLVRTVLF